VGSRPPLQRRVVGAGESSSPRPLPWLGREANRGGATDSGLIMGSVRVRLPPKPYDDSSSEFLPGSPRIRRYRPRAKKVGLGDAQCTGTP